MGCCLCFLFWFASAIGALLAGLKVYTRLTVGRSKSKRNLTGQVIIVTGANSGIGLEAVKDLAMRNARVIMACRSMDKGKAALDAVKRETGSNLVSLKQLDLSSLASVRKFASEILAEEAQLHVLVNNAGAATNEKVMTADGLETNFAANHFGPFLLTNLLLGLMQKTPKARVINVSSGAHEFIGGKELDLGNLNAEKTWEPFYVYGRTKLANILFTKELDRRLKLGGVSNITVNALHPGAVKTEFLTKVGEVWYVWLFKVLGQPFFKDSEEGAQTTVELAASEKLDGVSGGYYVDCKPTKTSKLAQDSELAKNLWDVSAKFVKLQENESIVYKKSN